LRWEGGERKEEISRIVNAFDHFEGETEKRLKREWGSREEREKAGEGAEEIRRS